MKLPAIIIRTAHLNTSSDDAASNRRVHFLLLCGRDRAYTRRAAFMRCDTARTSRGRSRYRGNKKLQAR